MENGEAKLIWKYRTEREMTQQEFAVAVGQEFRQTVQMWERGKQRPSLESIIRMMESKTDWVRDLGRALWQTRTGKAWTR